jgi:ParB family chromosome partitioning protein
MNCWKELIQKNISQLKKTTKKKSGLGSGIETFFNIDDLHKDNNEQEIEKNINYIKINDITSNPDQPRKQFKEDDLNNLVESIKLKGIIEPIIVSKTSTGYLLIAGERRLRAAQKANLDLVPVIIRSTSEDPADNLEVALIENLLRKDLNPIEEAESYKKLREKYSKQDIEIAKLVGKDRSTINNTIRLLNLPDSIKMNIQENIITAGHGKALLELKEDIKDKIIDISHEIIAKSLSVRQTEALVKKFNKESKQTKSREKEERDAYYDDLCNKISEKFQGLKVNIKYKGLNKRIEIIYNSTSDIDKLLSILNITNL